MRNLHKPMVVALGAFLLILAAGAAMAQETTAVEIRSGTVLAVQGNDLVIRGPEGVKRFTVSDDFRFNMDGKMLSIHDLKPGMPISAKITTIETPVTLTETKVVKGQVVHTVGTAFVIRTEDGELHKFTTKDVRKRGILLHDDTGNVMRGDALGPEQLRKGQHISATIVTGRPPEILTENELEVFVAQAPPPRKVVKKTPPPPPPKPKPAALPKTGSNLPLLGLSGLLLLAIGAGITLTRRFLG